MKKIIALVLVMMFAAMGLSACSSKTTTTTTATEAPITATEAPMTATEAPAATDAPVTETIIEENSVGGEMTDTTDNNASTAG